MQDTVGAQGAGGRVRTLVIAAIASAGFLVAAAPAAQAYVYWADRGHGSGTTVGRANLDGTGANQAFIAGATGPVGVAVDGAHVYWANTFGSGTTIGRANLNGTGANQSFITGAGSPCGVVVDGSYIYWANAGGTTIGRANLDGSGANESFITGANHPCGVAVDGSFVYWANESGNTIGRANLNGSSPNNSFITVANNPVGVAVNGSYIYWGIDSVGTIGRAHLDGTSPNNSFITGSGTCTDFPAVDATYIYWANDCDASIARANLDGTGINEDFISVAANPGGVAVDQLAPLTVSVAGPGAGLVTGSGISCPSSCSGSYTVGQRVTLTATPASRSSFAGWSGAGCSGTGACTITIGSEQAVTATFTITPPKHSHPSCAPKFRSGTVLLPPVKAQGHKHKTKTKPGTLTLTVTCDQAASLRLTGKIKTMIKSKSGKHTRTETFKMAAVKASVSARKTLALTIKLPKAALSALKKGARESVVVTVTATNANGTSSASATIKRLKHK